MVSSMMQQEWEALGEAEAAFAPEGEWETEFENEWESEFESSGDVRQVALETARSILPGAGGMLDAYGASLLPQREWESELEGEFEAQGEWEGEFEVNPVRKVYLDAMLEHMAHEAVHAESEQEAVESFLPLVPMLASKILPLAARAAPKLAARIIPRIAKHVTHVSPTLSRGISGIARKLYRNPGTRSLLRAVPSIAQRTMRRVAHQAATGRPITARSALRTLAQQTYRVLSHPSARSRALRRHRGMDRHYHGSTGIPAAATGARPRLGVSRRPGVCLSCGARAVMPVTRGQMQGRCMCSRCMCMQ
jgi:hypothetical protein